MRRLYKRYGTGVVFLTLSLVFIAFGIKNAAEKRDYSPSFVNVPAVITEKISLPDEPAAFLTISYTDLSGVERSKKIQAVCSAGVGDTIEIRMNTSDPNIFSIDGGEDHRAEHEAKQKRYAAVEIIIGAIMLAAGIFLLVRRARWDDPLKQSEE